MREILFKARRLDNGEWVEGSLVVKRDPLIDVEYAFILHQEPFQSFVKWHKVDTATVCQFTGLVDKNGAKIFEGDKATLHIGEEYEKNVFVPMVAGCWVVKSKVTWDFLKTNADIMVVNGNIHDEVTP